MANDLRTYRSLFLFSWGIIAYTIAIILWGAWVRLSGSGDGCGDHWPLCNGEVVPSELVKKTWIEYSHRISTAVYGVLILAQVWLTRKNFPRKHPSRFWAVMTLIFTITEALIGRQLVTSGLVNESTDISRLIVMPLHLINTSLLLFSGVMTAESVGHSNSLRCALSPEARKKGGAYVIGFSLVLISGAIAALGSHLMPSESLLHGLAKDLAADSHPAVKLRLFHPLLALTIPVALLSFARISSASNPHSFQAIWYRRFAITVCCAIAVGVATLGLLAPMWLKVTHLLMTNILVVVFSLCVFHTRYGIAQRG
jgi:cytochrome c oxidase assembly protein subunit 15